MDREPWPDLYDRELDVPVRRERAPVGPIGPHRRLLVNPLLSLAVGIGSYGLMGIALRKGNLTLFLAALVGMLTAILFTQFHCLDCGRTVWLAGRDRHACGPSLARWREWPKVAMAVSRGQGTAPDLALRGRRGLLAVHRRPEVERLASQCLDPRRRGGSLQATRSAE